MTDGETLALREGDAVEHVGYPGLRMVVLAAPRLGWPDYVKPGPPVLVRFSVSSVVAGPGSAEVYLSGALLSRGRDNVVQLSPLPLHWAAEEVDGGGEVIPLFPDLDPEGA